ncbi:hypothetical protein HPB52_025264 [Rhipicephalus sanguineus]|uniref:Uncharacterized protein n=1 Tax=Rhipicephalus sanguineus TaxID=34632 RepID=A0A9D4TDC1_RHISA|nr:hypothetical protein HPB52_025264 [Rhipicephalus sanguineus]
MDYPYLFSNHSECLLEERGQELGEGRVQGLKRSRARQIAAQLANEPSTDEAKQEKAPSKLQPNTMAGKTKSAMGEGARETIAAEHPPREAMRSAQITETENASVLPPTSGSFDRLLQVD